MKNLLAIGITGTLLYLGFKAFGLNRFNVYSVVRTLNPRITKVTLTGLSLATDISIDNPTNTSLKVSKPVVTRRMWMADGVKKYNSALNE